MSSSGYAVYRHFQAYNFRRENNYDKGCYSPSAIINQGAVHRGQWVCSAAVRYMLVYNFSPNLVFLQMGNILSHLCKMQKKTGKNIRYICNLKNNFC